MSRVHKVFIALLIVAVGLFFISHIYPNSFRAWVAPVAMEGAYEEYRRCMLTHRNLADPNTTWAKGGPIANCSHFHPNITPFRNYDETKLVILPKNLLDKYTMISLGVGHDVTAEEKMKRMMPNCEFHGVDPVDEGNKRLYEKVGKFYHFAIAGGQVADSSILTRGRYMNRKKMPAVPLYHFVTKVVKQSLIDYLFVDCESAEYEMFDYLQADRAAKEGITFCQINVEVHSATSYELKAKYHRFVRQLLEEGAYVLARDAPGGHHRVFFYNWRSENCRRRFFLD